MWVCQQEHECQYGCENSIWILIQNSLCFSLYNSLFNKVYHNNSTVEQLFIWRKWKYLNDFSCEMNLFIWVQPRVSSRFSSSLNLCERMQFLKLYSYVRLIHHVASNKSSTNKQTSDFSNFWESQSSSERDLLSFWTCSPMSLASDLPDVQDWLYFSAWCY